MSLDLALRLTEALLAWAFIQKSLEHLASAPAERLLFVPFLMASLLLLSGIAPTTACLALLANSLAILHRFQGAYNGGSDRMGLLILICLTAAHALPLERAREAALAYLAAQLTICYFMAGWVKVVNPAWRTGEALTDVFRISAYPVSEQLRHLAHRPHLLLTMSWAVIAFELAFPIALINQTTLLIALTLAALFHLANACIFGLNRFFWTWLAAYPSIIWLQSRVF